MVRSLPPNVKVRESNLPFGLSIWWQWVSWNCNVFKNTSIGENIICLMWWTCPSTTKQHGSANPYPKWVNRGCGQGNTESFNGKTICFNVSSGRGLKFHPPYKTTQGLLMDPQITTFQPFDKFHCPRDWIQPKSKIWTRNGQLYFMRWTFLLMLCDTQHS
jgi:hypothetical protein